MVAVLALVTVYAEVERYLRRSLRQRSDHNDQVNYDLIMELLRRVMRLERANKGGTE